jgi:acyl-[acyl-carrier-protein]-phospholipid O-acyltransferase/long-chain-fatty-acid--[acyl-carrier-protein] ligase
MSASLLKTRRFAPLFWCQFFSALNDNFLKNALVFLILFHVVDGNAGALVTFAGAALVAPFFFLSALGGQLADRYDKALIARRLKFAEIFVAGVAVAGFSLHSIPILFTALAGFGVIAALFGPIKYGILPDHLEQGELPAGNALIESATFLAILLGTIIGGFAAAGGGDPAALSGIMVVFALICWLTARMIPRTGEGAPGLKIEANILASTVRLLIDLKREPKLWWLGLAVSWFWLIGAVTLSLLPTLVKTVIGGSEGLVTAFLAIFSIAIAVGSGLASWLSAHRIVLVPTAIAGVLMGIFALDVGLATRSIEHGAAAVGFFEFIATGPGLRLSLDLAGLAIAGGLYVVPAFAALQAWAGPERRARVVAATNVLNAAFMTLGALGMGVAQAKGLTVAGAFITLGIAGLAVGLFIFKTLPTHPMRDFIALLYRVLFRVEVTGQEHLAHLDGRTVIALNHASFLDAGLALSLMEREPVFAIDSVIATRWWVKPFLRIARALPLDPTRPMATRTLIRAVEAGDPLVIFPEGRITVTGALMKVYDGAGLIADKANAVVVPIRIEGLERTPFSHLKTEQTRRAWFPKVRVTILPPTRLDVDPALKGRKRRQAAGTALYGVMSDLVFETTRIDRTVFASVVEAAEIHGLDRVAVEDPLTGALTYRRLLAGARVLGRKLSHGTEPGEAVAVMLPNANAAAATILGLMSAGRVPAMINFTAGPTNIASACRTVRAKTFVTSRAFVEKGRLQALIEGLPQDLRIVWLEDVRATVGFKDRLDGLVFGRRALVRRSPDDPAVILFTSGSEGAPKGVVLSSKNMLANCAQAAARIDFGRADKLFNVLPVFHSFGLTGGLILPLVSGVPIYLYPSPLHYRIVPELVYQVNATILFGTDTFLAGYARSGHPYDFRSIRYAIAGAEPVKTTTRQVWMEKFGIRILEGYGVTELSPVVALNTPMYNRFGTVGRLLPGLTARLEPVAGVEAGGRLWLKGPNVMLGYMKADNPGVIEPPAEGWHDTGDIVSIDAEGFVAIKGRAKRFAKVGGEMVSLAAVEALAGDLWPDVATAVATEPDPRKGERLVMLTTKAGADRASFQAYAKARGASDLMVPAEVAVVDKLPVLGSGKIDHLAVASLVRERAAAQAAQ